jgi:DNA-binding transcriptional MocR family regulator
MLDVLLRHLLQYESMSVLLRYPIRGEGASAIADSIEAGIRDGELAPGAVLPTVRALAQALDVSPTTVAAAYARLRSRGLLTAQGRRGTRVNQRPPLPTVALAPVAPGRRDVANGSPDLRLLPSLGPALARLERRPRPYGLPSKYPALARLATAQFEADGFRPPALAVVGGALEGIERVLQAHLRPGDRVAVEDPGYTAVLDLLAALGMAIHPVALDDSGPLAADLERALRAGVSAFILTPRAQNPTGAAVDDKRARELRAVLERHPDVLVIEDDHAGPISGAPMVSLTGRRSRWAVVRSVSKWLGPDLRVAFVAGDETTVARVEGRQLLGTGWVSHVLQELVAGLWSQPDTARRLRAAAEAYRQRRVALIEALAGHGIAAHGRSGLNVWVPVAEELRTIAALDAAGWAVRGGERYRIRSGPALRVTVTSLAPRDAERLAADMARILAPGARASGGPTPLGRTP